jgi:hypothetical protein
MPHGADLGNVVCIAREVRDPEGNRMQLTNRRLSAVLTLAVSASLTVGLAILEPATAAAPSVAAGASVTQECANAQTALALARSDQARAHRKLVKARKALRKARHTHRAATIKKAKRHLKQAKRRYVLRTHNTRVQSARVGYACSAPNSSARAAGTGMKLNLLAVATGAAGKVIDIGDLTTLLNDLLPPDVASHLSAGQLNALLSGFNAGTPSLDSLTVLLGSVFTTEELTQLLGGSPDPALVERLVQNIIGAISGLSGVSAPALDQTQLDALIGDVSLLLGGLVTATTTGGSTGGTGTTTICVQVPLVGTVCV